MKSRNCRMYTPKIIKKIKEKFSDFILSTEAMQEIKELWEEDNPEISIKSIGVDISSDIKLNRDQRRGNQEKYFDETGQPIETEDKNDFTKFSK